MYRMKQTEWDSAANDVKLCYPNTRPIVLRHVLQKNPFLVRTNLPISISYPEQRGSGKCCLLGFSLCPLNISESFVADILVRATDY
ncbi:hypothetical protein L6164_030438 [Bauhinia variegata]|uniref:Uncharacterized protein n=1 Tax=Bauhinia variegata TaxID=167791 RepID=A0ACB9LDQ2_BAUVA|nr:hypothetical protein L6164_030438 [Bauhinia variegata]